ncbi:hypothetical protein GHT06_020453 [Daphnia sinensis]|uniref:Uncharacterized protein n=1 Tax=Daphnia sinensis TaxID=1820382 RepID=A0AAD5KHU1_9CRUS|nr:hypothetical protein GHT06_020453 [Daphnia sinensis]
MQQGDETLQDQADHREVEPRGRGKDDHVTINVPPNVPIQVAPVVPPLIYVGNFKERDPPIFRGLPHEDVMEQQAKEKTPKVVRWSDQQTRAVTQKKKKRCERDASTFDKQVGGHVLPSRQRLKSPTRLDF